LPTGGREVGRRDTVSGDRKDEECLVLGDSVIRNVGTACSDMKLECFPGITVQLDRGIKSRDLETPYTVVIHVGTNDLRRNGNLNYVMEDVYDKN
jgi:hypothetical protein